MNLAAIDGGTARVLVASLVVGTTLGVLAGSARRPWARLVFAQLGLLATIAGAFLFLFPGVAVLMTFLLAASLATRLRRRSERRADRSSP
jgi:ABC-type dipeptide/oligopeptide/nickel transport system permease subunit